MTLTLDLSPDVEHILEEKARQHGMTLADYAMNLLEREVEMISNRANKRLAALQDVVETARDFTGSPGALKAPLSTFALSRAGAYESAE